jgi:uncharacterized protein YdeI (YjbR/CyaY-like superfamily)
MSKNIDRDEMPIGLTMSLSQDMDAMNHYALLEKIQQKELVNYIQDSQTGEEAKSRIEQVVNRLHDNFI